MSDDARRDPAVTQADCLGQTGGAGGIRLRVMSWNLHGGKGIDQKPSLPGIVELLREADPDIAAFQEVFRLALRDTAGTLRKEIRRPLTFFPSMGLPNLGYGCALMTRAAPVSHRTLPLLSRGEPRALGEAILEVEGRRFRFLVTHLGLDEHERVRQSQEIAAHLKRADLPTMLAGDFNAFLGSPELDILGEAGLITYPQGPPPTFPSPMPTVALDHLFVTPHFRVENCWTLETVASDHVPLMAEVVLPE